MPVSTFDTVTNDPGCTFVCHRRTTSEPPTFPFLFAPTMCIDVNTRPRNHSPHTNHLQSPVTIHIPHSTPLPAPPRPSAATEPTGPSSKAAKPATRTCARGRVRGGTTSRTRLRIRVGVGVLVSERGPEGGGWEGRVDGEVFVRWGAVVAVVLRVVR